MAHQLSRAVLHFYGKLLRSRYLMVVQAPQLQVKVMLVCLTQPLVQPLVGSLRGQPMQPEDGDHMRTSFRPFRCQSQSHQRITPPVLHPQRHRPRQVGRLQDSENVPFQENSRRYKEATSRVTMSMASISWAVFCISSLLVHEVAGLDGLKALLVERT